MSEKRAKFAKMYLRNAKVMLTNQNNESGISYFISQYYLVTGKFSFVFRTLSSKSFYRFDYFTTLQKPRIATKNCQHVIDIFFEVRSVS